MNKYYYFLSVLFLISACGGGGGGSSSPSTPTPPVTPTNPAITSFTTSSSSVFEGDSITLTWASTNANSCSASEDWDGDKSTTGNEVIQVNDVKTYSFTLTCSGSSGTTNAVSSVSVEVQALPNPSIDSFISSANSISKDESITLTWTTSNTTECSADVDWSGSKELNGSETLQLDVVKTYTFDLICTGAKEISVTESVSVEVEGQQSENLDVDIINDGSVAEIWGSDDSLFFFDELNGYQSCKSDSCQSVDWSFVDSGSSRGNVLEVVYKSNAGHAGLVVGPTASVNLEDYSEGSLSFDIKVIEKGTDNLPSGFLLKVESGTQNSGEIAVEGIAADGSWESVDFPVSKLTESGALNLSAITVPMVFFPAFQTGENLVYQIDNVRYTGIKDGATPPSGPGGGGGGSGNTGEYEIINYGAGNISTAINRESYKCGSNDAATWIWNAGVVESFISSCNNSTGKPISDPVKVMPQVVEPAASKKIATHRWWGSIPFVGETKIGDPTAVSPAHVSPDPIRARVSTAGVRLMGIPGGYSLAGGLCGNCYPQYAAPEWFTEVFDGIAIANSEHTNMNAYLKDYSDGSVTTLWKSGNTDVMEATFVHGSPYVFFKVFDGNPILKTLREDGGEKGVFYEQGNSLGVWTDVAGNRNNFIITGEGVTTFSNPTTNNIGITNSTGEFTVTYIPQSSGIPGDAMSDYFINKSRNVISAVDINYQVDRSDNSVTVTHEYRGAEGNLINTIIGLHPMHWKFSSNNQTSNYKIRSARGVIKFAERNSFNYEMPYVGVLPTLPSIDNTFEVSKLTQLVKDFVDQGENVWIDRSVTNDTYWSGKAYGKVAELIAISQSIGLTEESTRLTNWLKLELEDWFTAETNGELDEQRYFVYDDDWDTLLGMEEAYGSHTRLADHHFHYGYFVRAAAEICRTDKSWCGDDKYGPMIELLIRDYAGDDSDDMFPNYRNFDPANGFSWADGKADALQGNNNESTSEAANSYGALILYGLITDNSDLIDKGIYLHASTSTAYWQYWNNIDGYNGLGDDYDNFINGYPNITTSIIWSSGADFSTWFSPKYAHILGIQGLPSNPLIFHVSQYKDYMMDYIDLGLAESSNKKPSGLQTDDEWRDLWWNLIAMVDGEAAINDYESVSLYENEAGESKAHTYHWIHTFNALGHIQTGTGELTSNHPAAVAFKKNDVITYVAYNYQDSPITVTYSDGKTFSVPANGFKVEN